MIVYDFDGTLYEGDSSIDFFLYELKQGRIGIKCLLKIIVCTVLHTIRLCPTKKFKEHFFSFLVSQDEKVILNDVENFWKNKSRKLKKYFFQNTKGTENLVISASPSFLVSQGAKFFSIDKVIATNIDITNGKIIGENCKGIEKLRLFKEYYPNEKIEVFFSDTKSDSPMARIADKAFIVKKNKLILWKN